MQGQLLDAATAAAALGIQRPTLYAYVSRGLLRSHRREGDRRSWFDPADVERLRRRGRTAEGTPAGDVTIRSAVTLIADGRFWYRAHDAVQLATTATFEQVAELLWTGELAAAAPQWPSPPALTALGGRLRAALGRRATSSDLVRTAVPVLAARDPLRTDLRPEAVARMGRQLLPSVVALLAGPGAAQPEPFAGTADALWTAIAPAPPPPGGVDALQAALVLLADHELAASTSAVRIAASFRADPYAAVSAGLAVLSGAYHGAASVVVDRFLAEVESRGDAKSVIGEWLGRGDHIPGLGQVLYPDGDPRAPVLLQRARTLASAGEQHAGVPGGGAGRGAVAAADEVIEVAARSGLPPPNVDFALATLARTLGWVDRAGEVVFTVARMAGWLAHAIEEYEARSDLRLRAVYVGPRPSPATWH